MKKLLALTLTVIMALSLFVMPAYAEAELPAFTDVYAGQQTITFKLAQTSDATELTAEQAALVKITRMDTGAEIGFTNKITGDILTIMANDGFVINDADSGEKVSYLLEIGNIKKTFSVNKIWEDTLDEGETSTLKMASATDVVHLVDGKMVLSGAQTAIYPNESTYVEKENVSFSFKLQTLAETTSYGVVFNVNASTLRGDLYNTGWIHSTHFGWWNYCQQYASNRNTNRRASAIIVDTNKVMQNVAVSWDNTYANNFELARPAEVKYDKDLNVIDAEYGDTNTATLTIDKMGNVATFVQEGILYGETESTKGIVDVWNIADAYKASGDETIAAATPVKTGHFAITRRYADNFVAISDMILTETVISDYDDTLNITDNIYAGQDTITVKLSAEETITELRPEQAARIKLTRADTGEVVPFSNKISGDILTIMPEESFVINEADAQTKVSYILDLGDVKKIFTVNKLWEDKLDTAASTATADTGLKNSSAAKAVVDGKLIYDGVASSMSNGTGVYPDEATYINKENVSFSTKVQFLNKFPSYNIVFNMSTEFTQPYNAGWNSFVGFGFHTYYGQSGSVWYDKYTHTSKPVYNYNADGINVKTFLPTYSNNASTSVLNCMPLIELSAEVGATPSKNKWTDSSYVVTSEMKDKNIFKFTIDKMGDVATLVQEGKLAPELTDGEEKNYAAYKEKISSINITKDIVNVYNTADDFVNVTELNGKTAPKTGRFGVLTYGGNTVMAFYDMVLTETEIRDYEVGSFNVTDIFADKDKMTVTFDSNIEKADLSKVIVTQANGNAVECSKSVTDNELIITPNGGFVLDRVYNITITEEFGYDAVLVSERYSKDFRINKIKEITFDDGETYAENGIEIMSYQGTPAATIRNGKLYVQDAYYSTIYIRNAVDTVENYRVNFTMQRYTKDNWYNSTHIMFNAGNGTTIDYGNGQMGFGWLMKGNNSIMYRDYRHSGYKTGDNAYRTVVEGGFIPQATAKDVTFTANAEKGDYDVALPSTDATVYNIQLDKTGTKGALTVDGTLIDTFETKDVYKEWNALQTDESKKLESEVVPSKGDVVIGGYQTSSIVGTIAIGTITFTSFELIEDTMEIVNVTYFDEKGNVLETIKDATGVKGEVSVKSYFNGKKPLALIAVAYSGDEMLAADVLDINEVEGAATASATYSLSGLKGLTEIKVLAWESFATLYPYAAAFTK